MSDKRISNHNLREFESSSQASPIKHAEYPAKANVRKVELPLPLPKLNCSQRSLEPDMYFGWRPYKGKIIFKTEGTKMKSGARTKLKKRNEFKAIRILIINSTNAHDVDLSSCEQNSKTQTTADRFNGLCINCGSSTRFNYMNTATQSNDKRRKYIRSKSDVSTTKETRFPSINPNLRIGQSDSKIDPSDINSIIDNIHSQYDSSSFQFCKKGVRQDTNLIEIYYKVPYYDAIREYSDNWKNAVYRTEYKDVDNIKQKDPVFDILYQDCLFASKGKTKCLGKDPYSTRNSIEELEVKKNAFKEFKITPNINLNIDNNI